jgi:hypothetical protein
MKDVLDIFDVAEAKRAYPRVKPEFVEAFGRFFNGGLVPGGFLTACLKGDLADAVSRADEDSMAMLKGIVGVLYNHAPSMGWGTVAAFEAWLEHVSEAKAKLQEQAAGQ